MGRGRAKAKQTKVARELKYRTYDTDLDALQRELASRQDGDVGGNERKLRSDESDANVVDEDDSDDDGLAGRPRGG